jgi:hypothetical protein
MGSSVYLIFALINLFTFAPIAGPEYPDTTMAVCESDSQNAVPDFPKAVITFFAVVQVRLAHVAGLTSPATTCWAASPSLADKRNFPVTVIEQVDSRPKRHSDSSLADRGSSSSRIYAQRGNCYQNQPHAKDL